MHFFGVVRLVGAVGGSSSSKSQLIFIYFWTIYFWWRKHKTKSMLSMWERKDSAHSWELQDNECVRHWHDPCHVFSASTRRKTQTTSHLKMRETPKIPIIAQALTMPRGSIHPKPKRDPFNVYRKQMGSPRNLHHSLTSGSIEFACLTERPRPPLTSIQRNPVQRPS